MSATKRLNPLDWTFLDGKSGETIMMVGKLMPFSPPPDADKSLLRRLMDEVRAEARACPPSNFKLKHPNRLAHPLQGWVEDDHFDVEYHIRPSALPSPGDEREPGILVSRLHSNRLDFQRPPWEVHFIEGLEDGRFAIYFKVHHALVDGYTGIRLLSNSLSPTPDERDTPMFFSIAQKARTAKPAAAPKEPTLELLMRLAREQLDTSQTITRTLKDTLMGVWKPEKARDPALMAPMQAPKSILNQKISRNRRFANQQFSLERLKRVAKAKGGTLNDLVLVLVLCATAFRRRQSGRRDNRLAGHRHRRSESPLPADHRLDGRRQGPAAGHDPQWHPPVRRALDGAAAAGPGAGHGRAHPARVQPRNLERPGADESPVFPRLQARRLLHAVDSDARLRPETHGGVVWRPAKLQLHRLSRWSAALAAPSGA